MTGMPTVAPESFVSVCKVLYGDLIDPDMVWAEVAKLSPGPSDVHVNASQKAKERDQRNRRVTAGLSAVGATAGAAGLGYAGLKTGQAYRTARAFKVTRRQAARAAVKEEPFGTALVPLEVAGLGGELMATHILHGDTKKKKATALAPTGASKAFKLPNLSDIVAGSRRAMRVVVDESKAKVDNATRYKGPAPGTAEWDTAQAERGAKRQAHKEGKTFGPEEAASRKAGEARAGKIGAAIGGASPKKVAAGVGAAAVVGGGVAVNRKRKANALAAQDQVINPAFRPYDSTQYTAFQPTSKSVDFEAEAVISKIDDDKHLVFGWLSVSKINGAPVVDKQNDYIDPADLEEAAYAYVHSSRIGGDMHGRGDDDTPRKVSDLVESVVFTPEKIEKMGLPADFPVGWWGGFKVHDEAAWEDVKKGRRTGFSVHGKGRRTDVDLDELMGV